MPCFVTDLCQDFDLILGNNFLLSHKAVLDFGHHTVSLVRDRKLFKLKGATGATEPDDSDLFDEVYRGKQFLSCAQASRCVRNGCEAHLVFVSAMQTETATVSGSHAESSCAVNSTETDLAGSIASLQHEYADIFEPPTGLPPDRGIEHVIPLLPGAQPSSQRMY